MSSVIVACSACLAKNRFPKGKLADSPKCGRCKKPLFSQSPISANEQSFQAIVSESPVPVLVDFWAPWCGPCRSMEAPLAQIARERSPSLQVVKINVDENPGLAGRFSIRSIPQLMIFSAGRVVDTVMGAAPKTELDRRINAALRG
jgi:thioredoxin 2